jgi:hypothetical protein
MAASERTALGVQVFRDRRLQTWVQSSFNLNGKTNRSEDFSIKLIAG